MITLKIFIYDKADEVIKELFESILNIYQIGSETSVRYDGFIFHHVSIFFYKCHKINVHCSGSNLDFFDWIQNNK